MKNSDFIKLLQQFPADSEIVVFHPNSINPYYTTWEVPTAEYESGINTVYVFKSYK
jgi:hypothetical protein